MIGHDKNRLLVTPKNRKQRRLDDKRDRLATRLQRSMTEEIVFIWDIFANREHSNYFKKSVKHIFIPEEFNSYFMKHEKVISDMNQGVPLPFDSVWIEFENASSVEIVLEGAKLSVLGAGWDYDGDELNLVLGFLTHDLNVKKLDYTYLAESSFDEHSLAIKSFMFIMFGYLSSEEVLAFKDKRISSRKTRYGVPYQHVSKFTKIYRKKQRYPIQRRAGYCGLAA